MEIRKLIFHRVFLIRSPIKIPVYQFHEFVLLFIRRTPPALLYRLKFQGEPNNICLFRSFPVLPFFLETKKSIFSSSRYRNLQILCHFFFFCTDKAKDDTSCLILTSAILRSSAYPLHYLLSSVQENCRGGYVKEFYAYLFGQSK